MEHSSLDDVISKYLTAVESGEQPERDRLIADHPHFAEQLLEFFEDLDQMNRAIRENVEHTVDFTPCSSSCRQQLNDANRERIGRLFANQPTVSKRIGNYKLLQSIGSGGMGEVWMAEQVKPIRRRVAVKLIKAGMDTKQVVARFEAERQALAMMEHQSIAKILDGGSTEDGRPYFVMELVHGIPITQYCDQNMLSVNDRLCLFIPVCKAVQHAHQKGIIHRDLKPRNILVTLYDGRPVPKVIDFGLAKALQHQTRLTDKTLFTELGQAVGTLQYMSPEQAEMNSLDIDTRSDVYALGVLLYELLTGTTPIDRETLQNNAYLKIIETIREQEPPRPSVRLSSCGNAIAGISQQRQIDPRKLGEILRGDLDWIVMKALEKDRSRRYETANGFAEDVQNFIEGNAVVARPPSTTYRLHKFVRKNRSLVYSIATVGLLLVVATVISTLFGVWARVSERTANAERLVANKAREKADHEAARALNALERERLLGQAFIEGNVNNQKCFYSVNDGDARLAIEKLQHVAARLDVMQNHLQRLYKRLPDASPIDMQLLKAKLNLMYLNKGKYEEALARAKRHRTGLIVIYLCEFHGTTRGVEEYLEVIRQFESIADDNPDTFEGALAKNELSQLHGWDVSFFPIPVPDSILSSGLQISLFDALEIDRVIWNEVKKKQSHADPELNLLEFMLMQHPKTCIANTLGVAYYRREMYHQSIKLLARTLKSFRLPSTKQFVSTKNFEHSAFREPHALAFLALSNLRLGNLGEAGEYRAMFDEAMKNSRSTNEEDDLILQSEVNEEFGGRK